MAILRCFISIMLPVLLSACGSEGAGRPAATMPATASGDPSVTTTFTPTTLDFPNPERGFYRFQENDFTAISPQMMAEYVQDGFRLVYAPVRLSDFRGTDLPDSFLTALGTSFGHLRQAGLKAVLRFVYDDTGTGLDAPLDQVKKHIAQLKDALKENADVIAFWQAGFIGAWGEWHDSYYGLDSSDGKDAVLAALLDALPEGRFLQVRTPADIRRWYPAPATEADALAASRQARIGMHNDCFLASESDIGTYESGLDDPLRSYVKEMTKVVPFGGETCKPDPAAAPRTGCADILAEGRDYHLAYLDRDWYTPFHDSWQAGGCLEEVSRRMGYRIELMDASHPASATSGGAFTLRLTLRNVGWARIPNPRLLAVTLRERSTGQEITGIAAGVDPRSWLPGQADAVAVDASIAIPVQAAPGNYDVLVSLPDPAPTLFANPLYAIRPANADDPSKGQSWDAVHGRFSLGTSVAVH